MPSISRLAATGLRIHHAIKFCMILSSVREGADDTAFLLIFLLIFLTT
jgi:hypothetical protein